MPLTRKRKVSTSTDECNDADGAESTSTSSTNAFAKRARKHNVGNFNHQELCEDLFDVIRNHKMSDGRLMCEPFIRAPKRRSDPDYHAVITKPIDLLKIQNKVKSEQYKDVEQMTADVQLMVSNATTFYKSSSDEYEQAEALWNLFTAHKSRLIGELFGEHDACHQTPVHLTEESSLGCEEMADDETKSSVLTDASSSVSTDLISHPLKVPVLKLKVGLIGGETVDSSDVQSVSANETSLDCTDATSQSSQLTPQSSSLAAQPYSQMSDTSQSRQYSFRDSVAPRKTRVKEGSETSVRLKTSKLSKKSEVIGDVDDDNDDDDDDDDDDSSLCEELFSAVVNATINGRSLSEIFKILPSRKKLAEYYDVIKEPIDLRTIARKIQLNEYKSLDDMTKDLLLMIQNAKTYNKPGSQIYKDALSLRKVIVGKKQEIDQQRTPVVRSDQRAVRATQQQQQTTSNTTKQKRYDISSAHIASLKSDSSDEDDEEDENDEDENDDENAQEEEKEEEEDDDDDDGDDDDDDDDDDSYQWTLFNAVRNFKSTTGQFLCEPFLRLPSKRLYPDYYTEIKRPMSLMKINKNLKNGTYADIDEMANDFNLVCDNAKQYNVEESKIYKDAVRLQHVMHVKKQELEKAREAAVCVSGSVHSSPEGRTGRGQSIASQDVGVTGWDENGSKKKRARTSVGCSESEVLRARLQLIYRYILDYQVDGRRPIDIFRSLPSKKDYPGYYKVISEPIDMTIIDNKIKSDKYVSQQALVSDIELMFLNAKHYNEECSQVYKDTVLLEHVLGSRLKSLPSLDDQSSAGKASPRRTKVKSGCSAASSLTVKLQKLYNAIRDYTDGRGRTLSTPFIKLPHKTEYPEYYEIIKRPMDMQRISHKMLSHQYHSVDDLVCDVVLMFDNACRFNEPESLIYKDALVLQRVCLETKSELCNEEDSNEVPHIQQIVQSLMLNLFVSTFNHTDEEGRCFSDSFLELPQRLSPSDSSDLNNTSLRWAPSFEQVKRNLDKGCYRRMDRFQDDMFEVFEYARQVSSLDSQVFEDSVELQTFFIELRDELCKNGELLLTPALSFTQHELTRSLDELRRQRDSKEQQDEGDKNLYNEDSMNIDVDKTNDLDNTGTNSELNKEKVKSNTELFECKGVVYHIGDFVYIQPREKGLAAHIVCIERLHEDEAGEQWLYGCWFLRPNETYHLQSRKFLEKEVFKSDYYDSVPFSKTLGKCYVMFVKDYFKLKPQGYSDTDVFVCESRYSGRNKTFKKIKAWQVPKSDHISLVQREQAVPAVRVVSVFADHKTPASSSSSLGVGVGEGERRVPGAEEESNVSHLVVLDKKREVVLLESSPVNAEAGCVYYEQYYSETCGWMKLGDYVYLRSDREEERPLIACINRLWTTNSGDAFMRGPYYCWPSDVPHAPTRLFYEKEVFRRCHEDTVPLMAVTGRCSVLTLKDYTTWRVTDIEQQHVYLCESKYIDSDKTIKKFIKPFKKINLSSNVCDDEIFYFRKPIVPLKEPSPLLVKAAEMNEESLDCGSMSVDLSSLNEAQSGTIDSLPDSLVHTPTKKEKKNKKIIPKLTKDGKKKIRTVSGYILYAAECRKQIQAECPGYNFGEISRAVGIRWKGLPRQTKDTYEERARVLAMEMKEKRSNEGQDEGSLVSLDDSQSVSQHFLSLSSPGTATACDSRSMSPHPSTLSTPTNTLTLNVGLSSGVNVMNDEMQPDQSSLTTYSMIANHQHNATTAAAAYNLHQQAQTAASTTNASVSVKRLSPLFVTVPARTQRLLHSDAYLKYIEGLGSQSRTISEWDKTLSASTQTPDNLPITNTKLPLHWLGNGPGHHENAVSALWALRNLMLNDALNISHR